MRVCMHSIILDVYMCYGIDYINVIRGQAQYMNPCADPIQA